MPDEPGIYKFLDHRSQILYVGKAKNLKKRVRSYFSKTVRDLKTLSLVRQIEAVDVIVTRSEHEALVLERQLIREYWPKYNIALKDDKSYPYVKVTLNEPFPRMIVVRQKINDGASYFGPFPSLGSTKKFQQLLNELFQLRDCVKPIDLITKQRKCIQLDMGNCMGPCVFKKLKPEYDEAVQSLLYLLAGKNSQLQKALKEKMKLASEAQAYERAAKYRDQIEKIRCLALAQVVDIKETDKIHIWVLREDDTMFYLLNQQIIQGKLLYQNGYYVEKTKETQLKDLLQQSLLNFYKDESQLPDQCLIDEKYHRWVNELKLPRIKRIIHPKRGRKKELFDLAEKNVQIALLRLKRDQNQPISLGKQDTLEKMKTALQLGQIPTLIFGFDISHLQGQDIVASSVCFFKGIKHKKGYRKFKVKTVEDLSNDPASMREVVHRRLKRCLEEGESLPQLLLIDGGKAQLNAAEDAIQSLGISDKMDVVGLAKREEELYIKHSVKPIRLSRRDPVLRLLQEIRDESHRFANTFQKHRRKTRYKSILESVSGLGPKRIHALYETYKTLDGIAKADETELATLGKMGEALAAELKRTVTDAVYGD